MFLEFSHGPLGGSFLAVYSCILLLLTLLSISLTDSRILTDRVDCIISLWPARIGLELCKINLAILNVNVWTQRWPLLPTFYHLVTASYSMIHYYTYLVILSVFRSARVAWEWCVHDIFYCLNCTTMIWVLFYPAFHSWVTRACVKKNMKKSLLFDSEFIIIDWYQLPFEVHCVCLNWRSGPT